MEHLTETDPGTLGTTAVWRERGSSRKEVVSQFFRRPLPDREMFLVTVTPLLIGLCFWHSVWQIFGALYGVLLAYLAIQAISWPKRPDPQTESMRDFPSVEDRFPVQIRFTHRDVTYGEDRGVLSVMEGGLHFSGQRVDFSLTHPEARFDAWFPPLSTTKRAPLFKAPFQIGEFQGCLGVIPLASPTEDPKTETREMASALYRWDRAAHTLAWETTVEPPITPEPALRRSQLFTTWITAAVCVGWLVPTVALVTIALNGSLAILDYEGLVIPCIAASAIGLIECYHNFKAAWVLRAMRRGDGHP